MTQARPDNRTPGQIKGLDASDLQESHPGSRDTAEEAAKKIMRRWRKDPLLFLKEGVGLDNYTKAHPEFKLTKQQTDLFLLVGKYYEAKWKRYRGEPMTQEEADLSRKYGFSIRAGQGCGKTATLAMLVIWYLVCYSNSRIPCVAPKASQLRATLFSEISLWIGRIQDHGHALVKDRLVPQSDKVYNRDVKGEKNLWAAIMVTSKDTSDEEEQGKTIRGFHAKYMMVAMEEAAGIPNGVFGPMEGTIQKDIMNFIFMIFNPLRNKGYAYDTHHSMKDNWICLHWSNEDCELFRPEDILARERELGRDSNRFRIDVLGEFPLADDDQFIKTMDIEDAFDRTPTLVPNAPCFFGVDCAYLGKDKTAICVRRGDVIGPIISAHGKDPTEVRDLVAQLYNEFEPLDIGVDSNGLGAGVFAMLREMGLPVTSINSTTRSREPDRFCRLRDELFWPLNEWFRDGRISFDMSHFSVQDHVIYNDIRELKEELSVLTYKTVETGKMKFIGKEEMAKKMHRSCDKLDAMNMALYFNASLYERKRENNMFSPKDDDANSGKGWMSC